MSYTSQTTLTMAKRVVVDLTCSTKRVWPKVADYRLDVDAGVRPDMVWDGLTIPFPDSSVDVLYYDPPHWIGRKFEKPTMGAYFASVNRKKYPHQHFLNSMGRFSSWTSRAAWENALFCLNAEAVRVLKHTSELHVKLCEVSKRSNRSVQRKDVDLLTNFSTAAEKRTESREGKNPTYWLTMKPKPEAVRA